MSDNIRMTVPYFQVPNDVFEVGLNKFELLVYIYLCRCGNHGGSAFPSYNTIATKCDISRRKAIDTVTSLVNKGLIEKKLRVISKGDNQSNLYFVNNVVHHMHHPSAHDAPPSAQSAPYKEPGIKNQEKRIYINLPVDEHNFLNAYNRIFRNVFGADHMRVTLEQAEYIGSSIEMLVEYGVTYGEWREAVTEHFNNLPESNNGNILAFLKAAKRYFDVDLEVM